MSELSDNAKYIFETLYSKDGETIDETFMRAAKAFSFTEEEIGIVFNLQKENIWRPNTPVYFNSNSKEKLYSACWVVPLEDSMTGIYDVANVARKIFAYGAGIGIPIGNLREKDAPIYGSFDRTARCYTDPLGPVVCSLADGTEEAHEYIDGNCKWCGKSEFPEGKSSGPIIFMKLYDAVAATTKSGGRARRAAILCSMPVWHPDILDFINAKTIDGSLSNMNLSVCVTDKFMEALADNIPFSLYTPYNGAFIRNEDPKIIWEEIAKKAWETGDPGIIFIDTVNWYNPLKKSFLIESTNPCGEQPLSPWGVCQLSSINLGKFVTEEKVFDYKRLGEITSIVTKLMDNILDKMDFPDDRFKAFAHKYRPIGIGFMGLADAMFALDIKYNSKEGRDFVAKVTKTMTRASLRSSALLAKEYGTFFDYNTFKSDIEEIITKILSPIEDEDQEILDLIKKHGLRHSQHTTIAPTGTTAISCDCSYGIEPCFGLVWEKNLITGQKMRFINKIFESRFKNESWFTPDLIDKIFANGGSLKNVRGIPREIRDIFVVAHDIKPKERIEIQAACQQHLSTAISSTVNLPHDSTVEEIKNLYHYAYDLGLKGVTVYRDGCKKQQPVSFKKESLEVVSHFVRPDILDKKSHCIQLMEGKLYIDVGIHEGRVVEIWLEHGKSGQNFNATLEGYGKALSTAVQHGVPIKEFVKQFKDIKGENPVWIRLLDSDKRPVQIYSIPDAIAKVLEKFYVKDEKDLEENHCFDAEKCPKCSEKAFIMIEGCSVCQACGFSKCS